MMNATLLIELLTEELPPKALPELAASFAHSMTSELRKQQFICTDSLPTLFASPRRLALLLPSVRRAQPDQQVTRKGPSVAAGGSVDKPSSALLGFARSCGVSVDALTIQDEEKQANYVWRTVKTGLPLATLLPGIVAHALKTLPVPKMMRWGEAEFLFVRPVHGLMLLHGDQVIPGEVLGVQSSHTTYGHRFLSKGVIALPCAKEYERTLFEKGKVVASFTRRQQLIETQLNEAAAQLDATLVADEALMSEVTALVEWPVVLAGEFAADFLSVPPECLILTMQQNQKYFPLLDTQGRLMNRFLMVTNLAIADTSKIVCGNERVLRARLSDARFFFEQDLKITLESRLPLLAESVYHHKLGSQLARVERLVKIAGAVAQCLGADRALAERAARLAKADLLSSMVGEFPELQGVMGKYYARHEGEPEEVANAIGWQYYPRFAGDRLPDGPLASAVALADKLETLVGIWGIGLSPSGDKDPFGLRRAALGVIRILLHYPLNLQELLIQTATSFAEGILAQSVVDDVLQFSRERLKHYLLVDYPADAVEAVLALAPCQFDTIYAVLQAVVAFKTLPEAMALAAANKRVKNILKKTEGPIAECQAVLLQHPAEFALFEALCRLEAQVENQLVTQDFTSALALLASLKQPVDVFFDQVMVMVEEAVLRDNRLALLNRLARLFNRVADISLLTH